MNFRNLFSAISRALSSLSGLGSRGVAAIHEVATRRDTAPSSKSQPPRGELKPSSLPSSVVLPETLGLKTSATTPPVVTSTEALPSLGKIVSKAAELTLLPKATEAETLTYVPSTLASPKTPAGTPTAAPGTKTTTAPVGVVAPSGSSITGAPATITTPASPQPSANVTPPGTPQITTAPATTPPPTPSLSLAGGSLGATTPPLTTPTATTITPERMRELLRVLLARERAGGLAEVPEQIPLSYVLQPRRLLGEEAFQQ